MDLQREQIERQFDRAASTYDSVASLQRQMADRLLAKIPSAIDGPVVDLGCGTGDLLQKLSHRTSAINLTGVDISSAMLEQTRLRVPEARVIKSDIASLPMEDHSFQWAVSNAAIQWCESASVFSELRRILQPNGQAFLSTFGPSTMSQWRETLASVSNSDSGFVSSKDRVHSFTPIEQLTSQLKAAGFASVESEIKMVDVKFDSVRTMFDSVRKLGATNARRDRSSGLSGRKWLQRVTDAFEETKDSNGLISLTYECYYLFVV